MTPNDILLYSDQCLAQPSSENLHPLANGTHSQTIYRERYLGTPSSKKNVSIKFLSSELGELWERRWQDCKTRRDGDHQGIKAF